jgi:hypothetical protein
MQPGLYGSHRLFQESRRSFGRQLSHAAQMQNFSIEIFQSLESIFNLQSGQMMQCPDLAAGTAEGTADITGIHCRSIG